MHASLLDKLYWRLQRLPVDVGELGLEDELELLRFSAEIGESDKDLLDYVNTFLDVVEEQARLEGFIEPLPNSQISAGDLILAVTGSGQNVTASFLEGKYQSVTHCCISGQTGSGKSSLIASLLAQLVGKCHTFVIDSTAGFAKAKGVREGHLFLNWRDLRINPFDSEIVFGNGKRCAVDIGALDQVIVRETANSFGLQYGAIVLLEFLSEVRAKGGKPNLCDVLEALKRKKFQGFSRMSQYRDSAVLVLSRILNTTGPLFECASGFDLGQLLCGNTVVDCSGMMPEDQSFFVRFIFEYMCLLSATGFQPDKPIVFVIDEGQILAKQEHFSEKLPRLRHGQIHLVIGCQNISVLPAELLGNMDCLVGFQNVDARDRGTFARMSRLSPAQSERMGTLNPRECVCFLPRSRWKHPILATAREIDYLRSYSVGAGIDEGQGELDREAEQYLAGFSWISLDGKHWDGMQQATSTAAADQVVEVAECTATASVKVGDDVAVTTAAGAGGQVRDSFRKGCEAGGIHAGSSCVGDGCAEGCEVKDGDAGNTDRSSRLVAARFDEKTIFFMHDVLNSNPEHMYSSLTDRFERAGVRSSATRQTILKRLYSEGLIRKSTLALGRGKPITLTEPTELAFEMFGVKPWKKTRGCLATRAATYRIEKKIKGLPGWTCQREGLLGSNNDGKQVDLLCRDKTGCLVTIEVAGNYKHENNNLKHCLDNGTDRHWIICTDRQVRNTVQERIENLFTPVHDSQKVSVITLATALKGDWKP